jgi:hypothetical protein
MFKLKILETNAQIKKMIAECIKEEFDEYVSSVLTQNAPLIRLRFKNFMHQSPEFDELSKGFMAPELGFPAGTGPSYIYSVIEKASENVMVHYVSGKNSKIIVFLQDGWQDSLLASYTRITTESGQNLPWLHWLLTEGSKTIIFDHTFVERPYQRHGPTGRSLRGIMIKHKSWRIPEPYTGTLDRNFITELFGRFSDELEGLYKDILYV